MKKTVCIGILALMATFIYSAEPQSILFIGNSLTFFNDLPGTLAKLAAANGRQLTVASAVRGGETLKGHARREQTLNTLRSKDWDVVVMQGQSVEPIFARKKMIEGGEKLALLCPQARKVAYMTWSYRSKDVLAQKLKRANLKPEEQEQIFSNMQAQLAEGYRALAQAMNGEVAPVGLVWSRARKEHPEWNLFKPDGLHPSPTGTYLAAIVFYKTIFGELPENPPASSAVKAETHRQILDLLHSE